MIRKNMDETLMKTIKIELTKHGDYLFMKDVEDRRNDEYV